MKDHYAVLGLKEDCSSDDIKRAYRALAKKWHPDVNKSPDAQARFIEIHEAYRILSEDRSRILYDSIRAKTEPDTTKGKYDGDRTTSPSSGNGRSEYSANRPSYGREDARQAKEDLNAYAEFIRQARQESERIIKASLESSFVSVFSWIEEYGRIALWILMVFFLIFAMIVTR